MTTTDEIVETVTTHLQLSTLRAENARLKEALEFYADPESYFAVLIAGDSPCGEFATDYSDTGEPLGWRHGKRARIALGWEEGQ